MNRLLKWKLDVNINGFLIVFSLITITYSSDINEAPPQPNITVDTPYYLKGESFSLNCTVTYQTNSAVALMWELPDSYSDRVITDTNENDVTAGVLYNTITIVNATAADAGQYTCLCRNSNGESKDVKTKIYSGDRGFINLTTVLSRLIETKQRVLTIKTRIIDHPTAKVTVLRNNVTLPNNTNKYEIIYKPHDSIVLKINNININDTGLYTIAASNRYAKANVTYDVRPKAAPTVNLVQDDITCVLGANISLTCGAIGYPLPKLKWKISDRIGRSQTFMAESRGESVTNVKSTIELPFNASGKVTCYAENELGRVNSTKQVTVYEVPQGFELKNSDESWFPEGENVSKACYASKEDFTNVTWRVGDDYDYEKVLYTESPYSYIAHMVFDEIKLEDAGNYTCVGLRKDNESESETITLEVAERRLPQITVPLKDSEVEVDSFQVPVRLSCQADAVPPPMIEWIKDGEVINSSSDMKITTEYADVHHTVVNSSVDIFITKDISGKYECLARSDKLMVRRAYNVVITGQMNKTTYLTITGMVVFVLILLIVYLAWKIRKEKQFRKQLAAAGLLYFKEGVPKSLNPDLGIDEQAELLPYDERYEFDPEKLCLGKQLGAGAFGVVYKAEARGIVNAEELTTVAVKRVKQTADNSAIKALSSELKILIHLGKHLNIVNLLGACTKKIDKRELQVIVEYCKYGNLHNYMQRHRGVFIDQLTDSPENNSCKVNRAFSCSSGSSGMHSDFLDSNHTQQTENTFVNTVNTQYQRRSGRRASDTGYIQPEWRSNYEGDYSYNEGCGPRPLTSRNLLEWSFQIARGMEYLASRKVLHGDLAARNVLLAKDNVVKICDFGLARSIYKNDEYKKQENSPLPIKWLAIECMTDRIFSTQSDVWSFGVVMWELFSLAKTPYPNVSPGCIIQWLNDGHRLEKPQYADDRLHSLMLRCWEQKPTARPSFNQLQEVLGSFLEESVRNYYVDLNAVYMDMNAKNAGGEDYLAMVCAPDYNGLVTPSPHHYANDTTSFFPPVTDVYDEEGYLRMNPVTKQNFFRPRVASNKHDIDASMMNSKTNESDNQSSELTPMLTLAELPHDQDDSASPYLKMCPRIDEETDDVFETKQYNFDNARGLHNSAVTNPTYITLDIEKEPYNNTNQYVNVNAPPANGLVK